MTEKEYRAIPAISKSSLWEIRKSPAHFKYAQENPEPPTPSLIFGAAAHKFMLLPDEFADEFAVAPVCDRRTKDGKAQYEAFAATLGDKRVITAEDLAKIEAMSAAMNQNIFVKGLLAGQHEVPMFWDDAITGEPCKARADAILDFPLTAISDYKTCDDASTDAFIRSAIKYGYDVQAAMYTIGARAVYGKDYKFIVIAQEKNPPYAVNVLEMDAALVERGARILHQLIDRYHTCKQSGIWWGYEGPQCDINLLSAPAWATIE